jgi:rubrerythrin
MAKGETVELSHPDILVFAQSTIHQMKSGKEKLKIATSQVEAYKTAQGMEKESETFYRENAGKMKEGFDRQVFLALAKEERQHLTLLENMVEFITFPANNPVDAEFNTPTEK